MLIGFLLFAMAIMRLWPETPVAGWLREGLVEAPLRFLLKLERRHLVFLILLLLILAAGAEILALAGPPNIGIILVWDLATWVDAAAAMIAIAAAGKIRAAWFAARMRASSTVRRIAARRRTRSVRARKPRMPRGGDGDRWAKQAAFA